jgi:hypothetical protein
MSERMADTTGVARRRTLSAMTENERIAVRLLRATLVRPGARPDGLPPRVADAGAEFRAALDGQPDAPPVVVRVAEPDDPRLTRDERGLLQAVAAAQRDDEAVMDNYLVRIAPGTGPRARLAAAVRVLARSLARSGRLLASREVVYWSLPAAALTVARLHGHDTSAIEVAWPTQR